ncbi:hypothetical protein [Acetobacter orleanensis]|nr:hypothetical protein [Acetobacter orleanensis]
MSEMLIDELVVRLGLDTAALQTDARQTTQLLDKLRQNAEQTAASTRQAGTQASAALSSMRGEAVRLLAVLSGGRGLNRLLTDITSPAAASMGGARNRQRPVLQDSAPTSSTTRFAVDRQRRVAGQSLSRTSAPPVPVPQNDQTSSTSGFRTSHVASAFAQFPYAERSPVKHRTTAADRLARPLGSEHPAVSAAVNTLSGTAVRRQVSGSQDISRHTPVAWVQTEGQGTRSYLSRRTHLTASAARPDSTTVLRTPLNLQGRPTQPAESSLQRPFTTRIMFGNPNKFFQKPLKDRNIFSSSSSRSNATDLHIPIGWAAFSLPTERNFSAIVARIITHAAQRVSQVSVFKNDMEPQRGQHLGAKNASGHTANPHSFSSRYSRFFPRHGSQRNLTTTPSELPSYFSFSEAVPRYVTQPSVLKAENQTLSRTLASFHARAGRTLAAQPYLLGSPLLQAVTPYSVPPVAPAVRPINTTHIGPITITIPSGNPQAIAQALQGLGGGDSHTLTSLATIGTV